jgi:hypothetical protein
VCNSCTTNNVNCLSTIGAAVIGTVAVVVCQPVMCAYDDYDNKNKKENDKLQYYFFETHLGAIAISC